VAPQVELEPGREAGAVDSPHPHLEACGPPLDVEAQRGREPLDERRLAAAVLADQERHRCVEAHVGQRAHRGQVEREPGRRLAAVVGAHADADHVRARAEGTCVGTAAHGHRR
jgi:hypothetical protein